MYYFIPSWYSQQHIWHANDVQWYRQKNLYEFDDTVNQVRMFRDAGEAVQLVVLSYSPNLRHFLHRQNILSVKTWCIFDVMQGIAVEEPGLLFFRDLPWPAGVQWYYTPYETLAFIDGVEYASVDYGEDGNLLWVNYFRGGIVEHRDVYDDRGFLSSRVVFRDGAPQIQEYYDYNRVAQFQENLQTGEVKILAGCHYPFERHSYESLPAAMAEVLQTFFHVDADPDGTVIIASNAQHNALILHAVRHQRVVLSYFGDRFDLQDGAALIRDLSRASMAVTDTEHAAAVMKESMTAAVEARRNDRRGKQGHEDESGFSYAALHAMQLTTFDISPFDTRLSLGQSQRTKKLKVFLPIDGTSHYYFERAMVQILYYMTKNPAVELHVGIQSSDQHEIASYEAEVQRIVKNTGFPIYVNGHEEGGAEPRVFLRPFVTETDLIQILYDVRLIVDVRDQPSLYLQIAGISAGIPQVNYRFTRYVVDRKDGYIIQNINHVLDALEYYLGGLENWNQALIYCVQEIHRYSGGVLVAEWKKCMEQAGITADGWKIV